MAKATLVERLKLIDAASKKINEKAGKAVVGRLGKNEELSERVQHKFIQTPSMNVNEAIGGGWPRGHISIVSGGPDSGKTYHLLETIGYSMEKDPEFIAIWLESEHSLKQSMLDEVGIDMERFVYIEHDRDGAGEEAINRLEALLAMGISDMIVVNSLKCLVPSEEFKKDMGSLQVGAQARMNAKMMRKLTSLVAENEVAMVIVQHLTTQIGGMIMGDPMVLSGGEAIRYGAMLITDFRKRSIQESDPISRDEGIKVGVSVKKNHVVHGRNPYQKTIYYGIYGQGTEKYIEAIELAISQGILKKAGAFIRVPDENGEAKIVNGEKMQWQGTAKFRQYCMDNSEFFSNLQSKIRGESIQMTEDEIAEAAKETGTGVDDIDVIKKAAKAKVSKKNKEKVEA